MSIHTRLNTIDNVDKHQIASEFERFIRIKLKYHYIILICLCIILFQYIIKIENRI